MPLAFDTNTNTCTTIMVIVQDGVLNKLNNRINRDILTLSITPKSHSENSGKQCWMSAIT